MTVRIKPEDSSRIKILALAGWTPQEMSNEFPDYHPDQIRNHLNNKYGDEVKGKIKKDTSRGNVKMKAMLQELFPRAKIETEYAIGQKLRLDCYMGEPYNLGFEFDGIQHSQTVDHFGGDDNYIKNRQNDSLKEEICKGRGISLIRIGYRENLTSDLLDFKIIESGYGTGIIDKRFKTNKEKQREKQERVGGHAKRIAKMNYEKAKQIKKSSPRHQAQKEQARANRKANYQRGKAWAASRKSRG